MIDERHGQHTSCGNGKPQGCLYGADQHGRDDEYAGDEVDALAEADAADGAYLAIDGLTQQLLVDDLLLIEFFLEKSHLLAHLVEFHIIHRCKGLRVRHSFQLFLDADKANRDIFRGDAYNLADFIVRKVFKP